MKELIASSANLALVETTDGRLIASAEVVLLVSETKYAPDPSGYLKSRSIQTLRFAAGTDSLLRLSKNLAELAADAKALEARARLEPETPSERTEARPPNTGDQRPA